MVRPAAHADGPTEGSFPKRVGVELYLEFDLPLAQGMRFVVATFANERGDVTELTEVPAGVSECFLQEPAQVAL